MSSGKCSRGKINTQRSHEKQTRVHINLTLTVIKQCVKCLMMAYKVCQVIFSTNRLEYLTRTLVAQRHLDFTGCEVHKIFFDDFPKGRDNTFITSLVKLYGYNEIYLHGTNLGIGATWTEFWNLIKSRDYDYVWHQEDDVEVLEKVSIVDLIELLKYDPILTQVVLKRQPWYSHETESVALPNDRTFKNFRYEVEGNKAYYFSSIASLYSIDKTRIDYKAWYRKHYPDEPIFQRANINEALIGKVLLEQWRDGQPSLVSGHVKNSSGKNLIDHIGEYTMGKKLLPGEPGYQIGCDSEEKRDSRTS